MWVGGFTEGLKVYRRFMVYKGFYLVVHSCVVINKVKKTRKQKRKIKNAFFGEEKNQLANVTCF